jgi:hypothetical protein
MTKKELAIKQIELQERIQASGVNVVTCGNCGFVLLHEISDENDIECIYCDVIIAQCDCPDFWCKGQENNYSFITSEDVVKIAMDLKMNPSIAEIKEVLKYYPNEEIENPDWNWSEIVENLLYNVVEPSHTK